MNKRQDAGSCGEFVGRKIPIIELLQPGPSFCPNPLRVAERAEETRVVQASPGRQGHHGRETGHSSGQQHPLEKFTLISATGEPCSAFIDYQPLVGRTTRLAVLNDFPVIGCPRFLPVASNFGLDEDIMRGTRMGFPSRSHAP